MTKDELILKNHFHDMAQRAYQRGIPVFSDFIEKYQMQIAMQAAENAGVSVSGYGGYPDALRQMLCFYTNPDINYPIKCIRIAPANRHFCDVLTHRDYLGSVMNLGIERSQIGDIIVKKEGSLGNEFPVAYMFCVKNKFTIIKSISQIKHTTVIVTPFEGAELSLSQEFKVSEGSVASYRLDAVLAISLHISRGQCIELIHDGKTSLNGKVCTENAKQVNNGDVLSVRGHGKFLIETSQKVTRKGRLHIKVKQYI